MYISPSKCRYIKARTIGLQRRMLQLQLPTLLLPSSRHQSGVFQGSSLRSFQACRLRIALWTRRSVVARTRRLIVGLGSRGRKVTTVGIAGRVESLCTRTRRLRRVSMTRMSRLRPMLLNGSSRKRRWGYGMRVKRKGTVPR